MAMGRDLTHALTGSGLGSGSGLVFVSCGSEPGSPAPARSERRKVVVNGRRAKTVDIHAHCAVPEAPDAEQLEEGVKKHGLRGAAVGGNVAGMN